MLSKTSILPAELIGSTYSNVSGYVSSILIDSLSYGQENAVRGISSLAKSSCVNCNIGKGIVKKAILYKNAVTYKNNPYNNE